ncbi:MAG: 50S ribosomal protein L17 [Deltaproteobacteria bacterium]|jgi:large subunit ribosomal protein L17|nr:50S ribosomal protein L17 [Deltaproteobacteria bacterium]
MRHRKSNIKLGRTASHRDAMLRNMATSLLEYRRIETTVSKAKAVKPVIDRLVTLAKRGDLHSLRQAAAMVTKSSVLRTLFSEPEENYPNRVSGYVQMARRAPRAGDAAPMVILKMVDKDTVKAATGSSRRRQEDRKKRVQASRKAGDVGKAADIGSVPTAASDLAVDFSSTEKTLLDDKSGGDTSTEK